MNIENINATIALLEKVGETQFNMSYVHCGSVGCIIGFANAASRHLEKLSHVGVYLGNHDKAMDFLGIGTKDAWNLFYPASVSYDEMSHHDAIRTLEKLRDTGKVDWSHAKSSHDSLE